MTYHVIILCAGIGERLRPHTYSLHKVLLEIRGKTLIEHFLDALIHSGAKIDTVHIIVGHYGYKFYKRLGTNYHGLKLKFPVNTLYPITGAAQSLYVASHVLQKNPCIILEGDHYLDPELMRYLVESEFENAVLVDDDCSKINFDEEVLAYGHHGTLDYLKWLPEYPPNPLGEALTIFKLSKRASVQLATILEQYLLEDGPAKREIIEPLNRLIRSSDFHYITTQGRKWTEVDFEKDLECARGFTFGDD